MSHRLPIKVFATGLVFLAAAAWTAAAVGTVRGSVQGAGGPVVGAKVVIQSGSESSFSATARTDESGAFTFSNVPLGDVEVQVFDGEDQLLVRGQGILERPDEVITLLLQVNP